MVRHSEQCPMCGEIFKIHRSVPVDFGGPGFDGDWSTRKRHSLFQFTPFAEGAGHMVALPHCPARFAPSDDCLQRLLIFKKQRLGWDDGVRAVVVPSSFTGSNAPPTTYHLPITTHHLLLIAHHHVKAVAPSCHNHFLGLCFGDSFFESGACGTCAAGSQLVGQSPTRAGFCGAHRPGFAGLPQGGTLAARGRPLAAGCMH